MQNYSDEIFLVLEHTIAGYLRINAFLEKAFYTRREDFSSRHRAEILFFAPWRRE